MKALQSERDNRKRATADKNVTEKEKDEIISSLRQSLLEKQNEIQSVDSQWSAEFNRVVESNAKVALDEKNVMDAKLEKLLLVREKENFTALKTRQENFDKKVKQLALDLESYTTRKAKESKVIEAEWKIKLTALEDRMRCDLAAKEESFQREQELQRQSREMEEEQRNQMEEEIKLLTQQNSDLQVHNLSLQELAQKNDKDKAQFKTEEKKAKKEAAKTLKKDKKEEEEREKKEKKENEKREKEELKRQKKERKENNKSEIEELKRQCGVWW